jgi:hypothetical protein
MKREPSRRSGCLLERWIGRTFESAQMIRLSRMSKLGAMSRLTHKLLVFTHKRLGEAALKHQVVNLLWRTRKNGVHGGLGEVLASLPAGALGRFPLDCCLLRSGRRSSGRTRT